MKYTMSETLKSFLDAEISRIEQEEAEETKERREKVEGKPQEVIEYEDVINGEIARLESQIDTLSDEDKEYLEWLKNGE